MLILIQMEDHSIFAAVDKIRHFCPEILCEMENPIEIWTFAFFSPGWLDGMCQHCKLGQFLCRILPGEPEKSSHL